MRIVVTEKIKLTEAELNLLNRANELLEEIYQEVVSQELEDLLCNAETDIAKIMKYCEMED